MKGKNAALFAGMLVSGGALLAVLLAALRSGSLPAARGAAVGLFALLCASAGIGLRRGGRIRAMTVQKQLADRRLAQETQHAASAELEKKKHQLLALQSQINPHFLYNTLDTFRGMALEKGDRELSDMIAALSAMFKYSVNYEVEMVSISAELDYLAQYIKLQQLRFPGRFTYAEDLQCGPGLLVSQTCPRFVLQPVVENAIRHGLRDVRSGGAIRVTLAAAGGEIVIGVEDNGCGMSPKEVLELNRGLTGEKRENAAPHGDGGIGMDNVNARIRMFCGPQYGLHVASTAGVGTQVTIRLPLVEEKENG